MFILGSEFTGRLDLQDPEFWLSPQSRRALLLQGGSVSISGGKRHPQKQEEGMA